MFYLTHITGEAGASFSGPKSKQEKNLQLQGFTSWNRMWALSVDKYSYVLNCIHEGYSHKTWLMSSFPHSQRLIGIIFPVYCTHIFNHIREVFINFGRV
jgi:hypothetical protein